MTNNFFPTIYAPVAHGNENTLAVQKMSLHDGEWFFQSNVEVLTNRFIFDEEQLISFLNDYQHQGTRRVPARNFVSNLKSEQ